MFGHDDHHNEDKPMPEVPVNEDLLQPEDLAHRHDEAPTGPVEITPGADDATVAPTAPVADDVAATPPPVVSADSSDPLLSIKNDALQSLSPLISHLDQTPEEKFRTTMMLIQATDNKDLIADAYNAAKSITDEKIRAQALLDVVNEINYFTQHAK